MSRALVGARERLKQGVLADSALVGAGQRWWAMIQVVIQVSLGLLGNPRAGVRMVDRDDAHHALYGITVGWTTVAA